MELVDLINQYRAQNGVQPLLVDHTLMDLAQDYTDLLDATGQFTHTADGRYPWDRIRDSGFEYEPGLRGSDIGNENLHFGYSSRDGWDDPQEALEGWINSSGHNRNMLDPDWDRIGVGYRDGLYTGLFGDAPDGATGDGGGGTDGGTVDDPAPEPTPDTPADGAFSATKAVTFQADGPADSARVTLNDIVDENGSSARVRFEIYDGDNLVGAGTADIREGGTARVNIDPREPFDRIVVKAAESDVTGIAAKAEFTPIAEPAPAPAPAPEPEPAPEPAPEPEPSPEPAPEPEPTPEPADEALFGPGEAAVFRTDSPADFVRIVLGDVVDENGSRARIHVQGLLDGNVVAAGSVSIPEPGANVRFDPSAPFDEIRVLAGESDVTGTVLDIQSDVDGWILV